MRILLEYEPSREIARLEAAEQVAGNMRWVFCVPQHSEYYHTGTPSEPILAEAAARLVARRSKVLSAGDDLRVWIPKLISQMISNGLIGKGERGELVARILLTIAHDYALHAQLPVQLSTIHYSTPILVTDFIKALFPPHHHDAILNSRPQNLGGGGLSLRDAFKDSYLHFTQFVKAADECVLNTTALWAALARGMAYQCYSEQKSIDFILPMLHGNPGQTKMGAKNVTPLLGQVKNAIDEKRVVPDAKKLGFYDNIKPEDCKPYLVLVMQLGVRPKQGGRHPKTVAALEHATALPHSSPHPPAERPTMPTRVDVPPSPLDRERKGKSLVPRYIINVIGCSSEVYEVIPPEAKDTYAHLLSLRTLEDDLPNRDTEYFKSMQQSKPYWKLGDDTWNWVKPSTPMPGSKAAADAVPEVIAFDVEPTNSLVTMADLPSH